jgi:hypothetical protein
VRHARHARGGPRAAAFACQRELADLLRDQGVRVPDSATPGELGAIVRTAVGVDASAFVHAVDRARFGPDPVADETRAELRTLKRALRRELGYAARLRGFVSLRSLGLSG